MYPGDTPTRLHLVLKTETNAVACNRLSDLSSILLFQLLFDLGLDLLEIALSKLGFERYFIHSNERTMR